MPAKGGQFERDFCRKLSLWFSGGVRDDLFWRSATSGARATTRAKRGLETAGHVGDITACTPDATAFLRVCTVELKRGYNRSAALADLFDRKVWPARDAAGRKFTIIGFIEQAMTAAVAAKTPEWLLVHKRDGREPLAYFSGGLISSYRQLKDGYDCGLFFLESYRKGSSPVCVTRLDYLLTVLRPDDVRAYAASIEE